MGNTNSFREKLTDYNLNEDEFFKVLTETKSYIAGSFALSAYLKDNKIDSFDPNDLDIFVEKNESNSKLKDYLVSKGYTIDKHLTESDYGDNKTIVEIFYYIKEDKNIQIIVINVDPVKYIDAFDLNCCKTYYDNASQKIICLDKNIFERKTNFNKDCVKYNSVKRSNKYIKRGFKIFLRDRDITEVCKFCEINKCSQEKFNNFLNK
tara:strand:- start:132 stop:752 length:621 start_codon:yes stop_codon:yes gene_type:complete